MHKRDVELTVKVECCCYTGFLRFCTAVNTSVCDVTLVFFFHRLSYLLIVILLIVVWSEMHHAKHFN